MRRVMFAGGGTAGHVYPLLAMAEALYEEGKGTHRDRPAEYRFDWVGSERSESHVVPQWSESTGIPLHFHQIDIRFSWRFPTPANWNYYRRNLIPLAFGRPFRQARALVEELRPDVVVASGGYVSAPVLWAAAAAQVPYCLVQLDAVPGVVNTHFCPGAWRIYAATMQAADAMRARCTMGKVVVAGYPSRHPRTLRDEVLFKFDIDPQRRLLVVMGGSLGAGAVFRATQHLINAVERENPERAGQLSVLAVGGERPQLAERVLHESAGDASHVQCRLTGYVDDSVSLLNAADFYLGRSGAATVAELVQLAPWSMLIPDPQHADRQQYMNAAVVVRRGLGRMIEQSNARGPELLAWLDEGWDRPRQHSLAGSAAEAIARDIASRWERH